MGARSADGSDRSSRTTATGIGMPRRAKITALVMIVVFVSLSAWILDGWILPTHRGERPA